MNGPVEPTPEQRELLGIAGIASTAVLARCNAETLFHDLELAKQHFEIATPLPELPLIQIWIERAREIIATDAPSTATCPISDKGSFEEGKIGLPCKHMGKVLPSLTHNKQINKLHTQQCHSSSSEERAPWQRLLHKKGIRHTTPLYTWFGAIVSILLWLYVIALIILTPYSLLFTRTLQRWHTLVFFGLGGVLLLFFYLSWHSRCSVCKARIYTWKHYVRNKKAHHIAGLGRVIPTALHVLLFRWFRCPSCGTAQRLRSPAKHR